MEDCWVVRAAWHLRGDHRAWWEAKATIVWPRNTGSKRKNGWREIDTSPNTSNYPFYVLDSFLRFESTILLLSARENSIFPHGTEALKEKNCFSIIFLSLSLFFLLLPFSLFRRDARRKSLLPIPIYSKERPHCLLELKRKCIARVTIVSTSVSSLHLRLWSSAFEKRRYSLETPQISTVHEENGERSRRTWYTYVRTEESTCSGAERTKTLRGGKKRGIRWVTSWPVKTCLTVDVDYFGILPNGVRGGHTFFTMSHISILANVINTRASTGCIFFLAWAGNNFLEAEIGMVEFNYRFVSCDTRAYFIKSKCKRKKKRKKKNISIINEIYRGYTEGGEGGFKGFLWSRDDCR